MDVGVSGRAHDSTTQRPFAFGVALTESIYPALVRLEQRGWVATEWRITENSRRLLLAPDFCKRFRG